MREPLISLDQNLRVVTVSRSFYDFFKVKPEETVGQLIYDLGNKQWDIPKLRELLETILPQKTTFENYEVEHDFAGIGQRTMLLNARQIQRASGKERVILLAIEDITERKGIADELQKTRHELERVVQAQKTVIADTQESLILLRRGEEMRLLGQLTSGVAHEVRNPLNGIMAIMGALSKELGDNDRFDPFMRHMRSQVTRLTELMEALLALGRPILEESVQVVSLVTLVESALSSWLQTLQPIKPSVRFIRPENVERFRIKADGTFITQMIINLLENAHNHSQTGVEIVCALHEQTFNKVVFSVSDGGTGIAAEVLPRIFDPFFTTRKGGTGLGLSIVRKIVESHGGRIMASNNTPGPGATFEVVLPRSLEM